MRWSKLRLSVIIGRMTTAPSRATGFSTMRPTPRIAACGGLMMAMNSSTSNMPRLLMVNVAPIMSSGFIRPSRVRATSSRDWMASCASEVLSQSRSTAVTRPFSRATAMPM